jgi:hypothetical protein
VDGGYCRNGTLDLARISVGRTGEQPGNSLGISWAKISGGAGHPSTFYYDPSRLSPNLRPTFCVANVHFFLKANRNKKKEKKRKEKKRKEKKRKEKAKSKRK